MGNHAYSWMHARCNIKIQKSGTPGSTESMSLKPGDTATLTITVKKTDLVGNIGPGVSVEVKLLSASGEEYPKLIVLQAYPGARN